MFSRPIADYILRQEILRDRPVWYQPLDNPTFGIDLAPTLSPNPGTYNGAVSYGSGIGNSQAQNFVAANSNFVSLPSISVLGNSPPTFTMEGWFNGGVQGNTSTGMIVVGNSGTNTQILSLLASTTFVRVLVRDDSNTTRWDTTTATNFFDSTWHHVALTWDGTNGRLFFDAKQIATAAATTGTLTLNRTGIGALYRTTAVNFYAGLIQHVAIYNYALQPSRLAAHVKAGFGLASPIPWDAYPSTATGGRLFLPPSLTGLGSGGPFFGDRLAG